jgi:hypothetical protein
MPSGGTDLNESVTMQIPDEIQQHLNGLHRVIGELVFLREVIEAIKAEDPQLVAFHARIVSEKHNTLASAFGM